MRRMPTVVATLLMAGSFTLSACTAEKTQEGEMPDVDVDVNATPGQLPAYDVQTPTVEVGADTTTVITPDVDVKPAGSTP